MRSSFFIAVVCSLFASVANAQSFYAVRRERSLILVAGTGASTYFGELSNPGHYLDAKLNTNAGLQYFVSNHVSVRAEATWFTLHGSDAESGNHGRVPRNLSFSSNNYEIALSGAYNFISNGTRYYRRPVFNAYAFAGVGLMFFNPTTIFQGNKVALRPLKTELVAYNRFGVVIPFGLGIRLKITPSINIAIEGGYRKTFTDYLDDVSTVHHAATEFADPNSLSYKLSDRRWELGLENVASGTKRGNPATKDGYFLLNAKLEYYLPWDFQSTQKRLKSYQKKRNSMARYNKNGSFKQKKVRRKKR